MKFNFINGWSSKTKQWDRVNINVRISKLTILKLFFDVKNKEFELMILNFGLGIKGE